MPIKRKMNLGFGTNLDNIDITTLAPHEAGELEGIFEQGHNRWQFVQLLDAGPAVAGDVGYKKLSALALLTGQCTRTIGNSSANLVWGAFTNACVVNHFTLIRIGGVVKMKSEAAFDGLGAQGFAFTANNDLNGVAAGTASTNPVVAIGLEARGGTTAGFTTSFLQFGYK